MTQTMSTQDLEFYREAILSMNRHLDMAESMKSSFDYLSSHFPIVGISLHQFDPVLKGHKLFFLVTAAGFHHIEHLLPFNDAQAAYMHALETGNGMANDSNIPEDSVAHLHSKAVADFIPFKHRSYLVSVLWAGNQPLGHLVFMGKDVSCFTREHERKQSMLVPHFSVSMSNLLRFQRAIDFQKKLDARKLELEEELRHLRGQSHLVGANDGLKTIMDQVNQLKDLEAPVLIMGETGTGKEIIADTIQSISPRRNAPFVKVNCGAIPEPLVDSELFGYVKGAFTGAVANRAGRFEQASGGTIFLDEVGELPLQIQVRLLRVLQNHVVERLGSNVPIPVDVRLIAATNRNLETMLRNGTFREDLYYWLNVFPIRIPPLRDRAEDIPALACHFLEKICARMNRPDIPSIHPESFKRLMAYTWPGNVRELENLLERTLILDSGAEISPELQLPQDPGWYMNTEDSNGQDAFMNMIAELVTKELDSRLPGLKAQNPKSRVDFKTLDALMADHIKAALLLCGGKIHGKGGAGALLGVNPYTLRKKMEKLGLITKNRQTAGA